MERKVIIEPVYEVKEVQVKTGKTIEKVIYTARDGATFELKGLCEKHEKNLDIIDKVKSILIEKEINGDRDTFIRIVHNISPFINVNWFNFFTWKVSKDPKIFDLIKSYFRILSPLRITKTNLFDVHQFQEGDEVLISSWVDLDEDDGNGNDLFIVDAIKISDAIERLDNYTAQFKKDLLK